VLQYGKPNMIPQKNTYGAILGGLTLGGEKGDPKRELLREEGNSREETDTFSCEVGLLLKKRGKKIEDSLEKDKKIALKYTLGRRSCLPYPRKRKKALKRKEEILKSLRSVGAATLYPFF